MSDSKMVMTKAMVRRIVNEKYRNALFEIKEIAFSSDVCKSHEIFKIRDILEELEKDINSFHGEYPEDVTLLTSPCYFGYKNKKIFKADAYVKYLNSLDLNKEAIKNIFKEIS